MTLCEELRALWIKDLASRREVQTAGPVHAGVDHLEACAGCAAWFERQQRIADAIGSLARLPAPAELRTRCASELAAARRERLVGGILGTLDRVPAPAGLEQRLRGNFAAQEAEAAAREGRAGDRPLLAGALAGLARRDVPAVLDRLVSEELADPTAARARRFAGDLERRRAPFELERRVRLRVLGRDGARGLLRIFVPVALAAGLLAVAAQRWSRDAERKGSHLEVVELSSLTELEPVARDLLAALGGGMLAGTEPRFEGRDGRAGREGSF
jgi:hypothetical protein